MNETMRYVATGIMFALGAVFGSFANVVIYRLPRGMSVTSPARSFCPACGSTVPWFDNIPILSFILLRARCRFCHAPISPRYLAVELLCAAGFAAAAYLQLPDAIGTVHLAAMGFFCVTTVFIAVRAAVPWRLWLTALVVGLALAAAKPSFSAELLPWLPLPKEPHPVMERVRGVVGAGLVAGGVGAAAFLMRLLAHKLGWEKPRGSVGAAASLAPFLPPDTFVLLFGATVAAAAIPSLLLTLIFHKKIKLPHTPLLAAACWFTAALNLHPLV